MVGLQWQVRGEKGAKDLHESVGHEKRKYTTVPTAG